MKENGVWRLNYICRYYLGNITHITDNSGKLLAEYSYDAWGRIRNPVNQNVYLPGSEPDLLLGRGYTGHEHLSVFGLINMNARLYDPVLGRFLSPDPFVQLPDNLRSLNRYGYGMCNPLCYVDENGEFWWIVAAAVIGGVVNAAIHSDQINSVGSFFGYFGVGAAAGALGAVTGGAIAGAVGGLSGVAGGAIIGAGSGAASGAVFGAGNAAMAGGNFGDIMSGGLSGAASGALSGAVTGGAFGGAVSYFKGQNVWTGADVAAGRSQFSFKNTPVAGGVKAPKVAVEPDVMPKASQPSKPMASVEQASEMSMSLKTVTEQTGSNYTRFIVEPNGVIHDMKPTIDRINTGKLYSFRNDGAVYYNKDASLPSLSGDNVYKEYVHLINPQSATRPGPMRVIVGNDGKWFTPDHYLTIIRIEF